MTKKQQTIVFSSSKAEYMSEKAAREVAWLEKLTKDLGLEINWLVIIHCDNEARIKMATNPNINQRTKQITAHYH